MILRLLSKIKYRGVAMVEYAVLLAFVCVVAAFFEPSNGISGGVNNIIGNLIGVFDGNTTDKKPVKNRFGETAGVLSEEWLKDNMLAVLETENLSWNREQELTEKQQALVNSIANELGVDPNNITVIKRTGNNPPSGVDEYGYKWFGTYLDIYVDKKLTDADSGKRFDMMTYAYGYYSKDPTTNAIRNEKAQLLYVEKYNGILRDSGDTGTRKNQTYLYGEYYASKPKGQEVYDKFN